MQLVLKIVYAITCLILIAVVLFQSGKQAGLSGIVSGASETFFGKNKGRTIDAMLDKWTSVVAIVFILLSIALTIISKAAL
jgi:preprotein translocase subunit SecG